MAYKKRKEKSSSVLRGEVGSGVAKVPVFRVKNLTDAEVPVSVLRGSKEVLVRIGPYKYLEVSTLTDSIKNLRDKKLVEIK